jgi:hypothetical protein
MQSQIILITSGVLITLILGCFSGTFLDRSVTARPASSTFQVLHNQTGGGGKQLGVFERLMFFASFVFGEYTIAAGWLGFKVATKWAVWQHVAKLPDSKEELNDRAQLSAYLYGRFTIGTLYNGFCAAIGGIWTKILGPYFITPMLNQTSNERLFFWVSIILTVAVMALIAWSLLRPERCNNKRFRLTYIDRSGG